MLEVTMYNLSVKISTNDGKLLEIIRDFLSKYYTVFQQGFNKNVQVEPKLFASKILGNTYILHTNQFIHLYYHIEKLGYPFKADNKIDAREYNVISTDFKVRDRWELRDYQKTIMEFLLDNPVKSKLVPAQTGSGKTVTALYTIAKLNKRLGIVILPQFIEKWILDIANIHEAETSEIMVIQGSKSLRTIIDMAKTDSLINDYYIFSNRTLQEFISQYEEDPELCVEMYGCEPIELFPLLGIGVMLVDESHMQFHSIFKILIHTNVKFQIGLSATLVSDDNVVTRMHGIVYPSKTIYADEGIVKYTDLYPIAYTINHDNLKFIKTKNYGSNTYSHIAFEKSIIRNKYLNEKYFNVIKTTIEDYYNKEYIINDKLIIFVSLIEMATYLTDKLSKCYLDKKVVRYCEEDSYDEMLSGDIIVSTPTSLAVGIDVPNLRTVIMTVSISSIPTNIQSFGRLRKLSNRDTKFCYIYCDNIPKHKEYHMKRLEIFSKYANTINLRRSRVSI